MKKSQSHDVSSDASQFSDKVKIYLVGGAVRDEIMGLPVKDHDYVIVGATEAYIQWLRLQKFKQVGKDFPVFLHPVTKEEFALARTERKVGRGYTGFTFNTAPDVTLQQDLMRRDLTINALARATNNDAMNLSILSGEEYLVDYFGGQDDIHNKVLKHVSDAFSEDPVRILRIARFSARYPDFRIADETMQLMKNMVAAGEVDALVPERVWKELEGALSEKVPGNFLSVLSQCGALEKLFPELINQGLVLSSSLSGELANRSVLQSFAMMLFPLDVAKIISLCERYRVPSEYREFALLVNKYFGLYEELVIAEKMSAPKILKLFVSVDAFRREDRFKSFLNTCKVVLSQKNVEVAHFIASYHSFSSSFVSKLNDILLKLFAAAKNIDTKKLISSSDKGPQIAEKIQDARLQAINEFLSGF